MVACESTLMDVFRSLVDQYNGCLFVMGSRARNEAGVASDLEFGIILPDTADIASFKAGMLDEQAFERRIAPVPLDRAHSPWESYLKTQSDLIAMFVSKRTDSINGYLFTDTRCVVGSPRLLVDVRAACHAAMLPLPEEHIKPQLTNVVRFINDLSHQVCGSPSVGNAALST
jgi:hypothetical protein